MVTTPTVTVWAPISGTQWGVVGDLPAYESLSVEARHNDAGPWQMTIPYDVKGQAVAKDRLLTVDWRSQQVATCLIETYRRYSDTDSGATMLDLSGSTGLKWLSKTTAFPHPDLGINASGQDYWDPNAAAPIISPAESAVLKVIRDNVVTRRTLGLSVPSSSGRGTTVHIRPAFDNLMELAAKKATLGGIGIRLALVPTSGSRANLTVQIYIPTDKRLRVLFAEELATLAGWDITDTAPTVTRALVSGVPGQFESVSNTVSVAAGDLWGGRVEQFVQGPQSFDNSELDDAGTEALDAGQGTSTLTVDTSETANLQALRDWREGDIGSAKLPIGGTVTDVITAMRVTVDDDGPHVTAVFGDPDGSTPEARHARLLRAMRRDVDRQKRRS